MTTRPSPGGRAGPDDAGSGSDGAAPAVAGTLDTPGARRLAALTETFGDLQYVLLCCEHLVAALGPPPPGRTRGPGDAALVEALWTGALVGYARCFSARAGVLTDDDVTALGLAGEVREFHDAVRKLRDHYASRHVNPRESLTVGVVLEGGTAAGVAVLAEPRPTVDDLTVRTLGRIAYGLSTAVDERIGAQQAEVMAAAAALSGPELSRLPQVRLPESGAAGT